MAKTPKMAFLALYPQIGGGGYIPRVQNRAKPSPIKSLIRIFRKWVHI